jgi:BirA family biotin operon repressor/biotin-[acetyl-CoA-carboxylase] ligase
LPVSLKWPNDLVAGGKKLAGILVEGGFASQGLSFAVVGVGVNVNGQPPIEGATSIEALTASPQGKEEILQDILGEMKAGYLAYLAEGIEPALADYRRGCITLNREVIIIGPEGKARAKAIDVGSRGELLVEYPDGCRRLVFADEVSLRTC